MFIDGLELMCFEICMPKQKPYFAIYWYRPPSSQNVVFDQLETLLQSLELTSKDIIIYGDLNCDLYHYSFLHSTIYIIRLVNVLCHYKLTTRVFILPQKIPCT